jgi:uncharacterized protein involved in exopolysaccharide biosynthesis
MIRTLESVFRHPIQLLILLIVLPITGVAIEYFTVPRTYQATASLWALQRYEIIGTNGLENDLSSSPAETQVTALNELLQTHVFVDAVVKGVDLAPALHLDKSVTKDPQQLENVFFDDISKHVFAYTQAFNLFQISYTNPNPQIARQIVDSVIRQFGAQSLGLSVIEGQNLINSYQVELTNAQKAANTAAAAEARYTSAHPNSRLTSDPQLVTNDPELASLDGTRLQALKNAQSIQDTINTIQAAISAQGSSVSNLFQVLDPPQAPNRPASRTRSYLVGGGIGLAVALLASVLFLVILVRRDHKIYSEVELQHVIPSPLVMQLPTLSPSTISLLTLSTTQGQVELIEGRSSGNGHEPGSRK